MKRNLRRVLTVIMDGVGVKENSFGNAVKFACTPQMAFLKSRGLYTELKAHGTYVGLPSDSDIGNSEVGHNALGAGRIFDQGAKLVQNSLDSGEMFRGPVWRHIVNTVGEAGSTLHFIGLLSDGNVHSHQNHLHAMLRQARKDGLKKIRIHVLMDGRDVGERSAELYCARLSEVINQLRAEGVDVAVASGGGRMNVTMDRYEADWSIVERGWNAHVHGRAAHSFCDLASAIAKFREDPKLTDQYFPPFVICGADGPLGPICDKDAVVFFNFRGDRAIEICQAFEKQDFSKFDRGIVPKVYFAGMMEYDGDLHVPKHYLVNPPLINSTLGEHLAGQGLRQFACSETQKYGHVTYFWNGNRSGMFDPSLEEYREIPSDVIRFDLKPWMKVSEITDETIAKLTQGSFDFGRINFAAGDMVGHTGNFEAAVIAVAAVDLMLGRLIEACQATQTILIVTADHGNCDEMFEGSEIAGWESLPLDRRPPPKTSHTLNPVPCYIYDPVDPDGWRLKGIADPGIANFANTALTLMGLDSQSIYLESLVTRI